jgi:hypothetical protein
MISSSYFRGRHNQPRTARLAPQAKRHVLNGQGIEQAIVRTESGTDESSVPPMPRAHPLTPSLDEVEAICCDACVGREGANQRQFIPVDFGGVTNDGRVLHPLPDGEVVAANIGVVNYEQ